MKPASIEVAIFGPVTLINEPTDGPAGPFGPNNCGRRDNPGEIL